MSDINARQGASKPDTIVTAKVVRNTTSPSEKANGSMNYVLVLPVKEIFKFDVDENLRIYFGEDDSIKNRTPIHKEIFRSFEEDPQRFVQKNSGFTVVCNSLTNDNAGDFGLSNVTLKNASLINGAQSQGELKKFFDEGHTDQEHHDADVRVEVIVETNAEARIDIANARNSSTNVTNLSKLGGYSYFEDLEKSMKTYNPDWKIAINETDNGIPTQTLLQVIRTMIPMEIREKYKKLAESETKSYSGKASVLSEFKIFKDNDNGQDYSEIYDFYINFAPYAWETYLEWLNHNDWMKFYKKNEKIGKYSERDDVFELSWGIMCPFLSGLQNFVIEDSDGPKLKYPKDFNKGDYVANVISSFSKSDSNPQTYAKDRSSYLSLYIYTHKYKS